MLDRVNQLLDASTLKPKGESDEPTDHPVVERCRLCSLRAAREAKHHRFQCDQRTRRRHQPAESDKSERMNGWESPEMWQLDSGEQDSPWQQRQLGWRPFHLL